jgi:hypothetical protein
MEIHQTRQDEVDHPSHYTAGKQEAIDVIEDVIRFAPDPVSGSLQWQVLKYVLRMWLKGNPIKDAKKSAWYLNRLIARLEKNDGVFTRQVEERDQNS